MALQKLNCLISVITKEPHLWFSITNEEQTIILQWSYSPTEHLTFSVTTRNWDTQERAKDPTTALLKWFT